jgi:alkylhydroperoxidase family enzyme
VTAHIPPLTRAEVDADALGTLRRAFPRARALLTEESDAPLPPILGLLARHPDLGAGWLAFNGVLLDDGRLDARTRELVLLAVVEQLGASYLWHEHVRIGTAAGLTDDEIGALASRRRAGWSTLDAALLSAVDELLGRHQLTDDTWETLAEHFEESALLELLFVVGSYCCLALVLNGAGLTAPDRA